MVSLAYEGRKLWYHSANEFGDFWITEYPSSSTQEAGVLLEYTSIKLYFDYLYSSSSVAIPSLNKIMTVITYNLETFLDPIKANSKQNSMELSSSKSFHHLSLS